MADVVFIVLLILHLGSVVAWMGGATAFVSVISPSLRKMSSSARAEFVVSTLPSYTRFIITTSSVAIVAGVLLFGYITMVTTALAPTGTGLILVEAGAGSGLVVTILALGVIVPTGRKMVSLAKQVNGPTSQSQAEQSENPMPAQIASLQKRLSASSGAGVALLALTLILMIAGASI